MFCGKAYEKVFKTVCKCCISNNEWDLCFVNAFFECTLTKQMCHVNHSHNVPPQPTDLKEPNRTFCDGLCLPSSESAVLDTNDYGRGHITNKIRINCLLFNFCKNSALKCLAYCAFLMTCSRLWQYRQTGISEFFASYMTIKFQPNLVDIIRFLI